MRKLVLIGLVGGSVAVVSGCGSSGETATTAPTKTATTTVTKTVTTPTTTVAAEPRETYCGTFTAPGETVRRTTWRVYARDVACSIAYPVVVRFNRTGRPVPGWRCTGEDVLTRCYRGAASVRAVSSE
jgi:hypothetical protein